ncbi:hypothetical protein Pdw03_7236 [Penicillium digitatum]|uniref:Uncharacterized protein n=1 Tax=Penicillium digitatum TaxID=36651 RepID=A0A7T6XLF8_PENDI|nr:hypothetical protein Pdw03_7236 [Penicillium digitatum]
MIYQFAPSRISTRPVGIDRGLMRLRASTEVGSQRGCHTPWTVAVRHTEGADDGYQKRGHSMDSPPANVPSNIVDVEYGIAPFEHWVVIQGSLSGKQLDCSMQ